MHFSFDPTELDLRQLPHAVAVDIHCELNDEDVRKFSDGERQRLLEFRCIELLKEEVGRTPTIIEEMHLLAEPRVKANPNLDYIQFFTDIPQHDVIPQQDLANMLSNYAGSMIAAVAVIIARRTHKVAS